MIISQKLFYIIISFTVLPMVLIAFFGFNHAYKTIIEMQLQPISDHAMYSSDQIDVLLTRVEQELNVISNEFSISKDAYLQATENKRPQTYSFERSLKHMQSIHAGSILPPYIRVAGMSKTGERLYGNTETGQRFSLWLEKTGLKGSLPPKKIDSSRQIFFPQEKTTNCFIYFLNPIKTSAFSQGPPQEMLLILEVNINLLIKEVFRTWSFHTTGEILVLALKDGNITALSPLSEMRQKSKTPFISALMDRAFATPNGKGIFSDFDNKRVISAWNTPKLLPVKILVKSDRDESLKPIYKLGGVVISAILSIALLGILATKKIAASISKPIQQLEKGVNIVGQGNLDYRVGTQNTDEIGKLSRAFDEMTINLKALTTSRKNLEDEIAQRKEIEISLAGRLRELNCLYMTTMITDEKTITIQEMMKRYINLIPQGFMSPELIWVRFTCGNTVLNTTNYKQSQHHIDKEITSMEGCHGILQIGWLGKNTNDGSPFLEKDQKFIETLTKRIEQAVQYRLAEEAVIKSEEQFRLLVEDSPTGIAIVKDMVLTYKNKALDEMLDPHIPFKLPDVRRLHPDDVNYVVSEMNKVFSGEKTSTTINFRAFPLDKNGNQQGLKYVLCRISRLATEENTLIMSLIDLTQVNQLETMLADQEKMASLGRISAGIAHEIRNPLSGLNIYLSKLKKNLFSDPGFDDCALLIERIEQASGRIESVIKRVMDFSKPTNPKRVPVDINKLALESLELAASMLDKKFICIDTVFAPSLPTCLGDPVLLEEVLLNLIMNASDAMEATYKPLVRLSTSRTADNIIICCSDNGPGMSNELKKKVFEPFVTTKKSSTGIGLAICHRIILDHGGTIKIVDSEFWGAEFVLTLPIEAKSA